MQPLSEQTQSEKNNIIMADATSLIYHHLQTLKPLQNMNL